MNQNNEIIIIYFTAPGLVVQGLLGRVLRVSKTPRKRARIRTVRESDLPDWPSLFQSCARTLDQDSNHHGCSEFGPAAISGQ